METDPDSDIDDECLRKDLPTSDEEALRVMDIHTGLITKGMLISENIAQSAAVALLPLLRVNIPYAIWVKEQHDALTNVNAQMRTYLKRFHKFIADLEKLEGTSGVSVEVPLCEDEARIDALWFKCLLLVTQNFNLRARRLCVLRRTVNPLCDEATMDGFPMQVVDPSEERRNVEDMYRNSARARQIFQEDMDNGTTLEMAKRRLHANTNAMFTQFYGTIQTFLAYVENGTLLQCQGKRKIANTSETLKLAVSICQLPGRADWWFFTEGVVGGGSGRLLAAATRRLKRERKTTLSSRSRKRGRCADQRLARAAPDMAGVVSLSVPAPSRCGPQGKASSTHIPSGRVDAITKKTLAMLEKR